MEVCPLCGLAAAGDMVHPGPAWQPCHRACFIAWDNLAEAEDMAQANHPCSYGPEPVREALRA